jgi:homoserine kinase type II
VSVAHITNLESKDIGRIVDEFSLGELVSCTSINAGTVNSNYKISTAATAFFVRVNEGKSAADVRWEAQLLLALHAANVPIAGIVGHRNGQPLMSLRCGAEEKFISVFEWLDGHHLGAADVSVDNMATLGHALANFHRATELLTSLHRPNRYDVREIERRLTWIESQQRQELTQTLALLRRELSEVAPMLSTPQQRPLLMHGDLFRDNVLWQGQRLLALLDFEQASSGNASYDMAVCLHDWCWTSTFQWSTAQSFLLRYHQSRALTNDDLEGLPWQLRWSAVRFTVTRLTDVYLAGRDNPDKDFRAFLARVEFWQSESSIARLRELTNSVVTR